MRSIKLNKVVRLIILGHVIIPLVLTANVLSQNVIDQANTLIKEQIYLDNQKENFNDSQQHLNLYTKDNQ